MGRRRCPLRGSFTNPRLFVYVSITPPSDLFLYLRLDDDYALSVLATALKKSSASAEHFRKRGTQNPFTIFNTETGFMEAKNADGSWAGEDAGWTEGDKWAYSFDVVQDVPALIEKRGGNASFVQSLEDHFNGGKVFFRVARYTPHLTALFRSQ